MKKKVSVVLFVIGVCLLAALAVRAQESAEPGRSAGTGGVPAEPVEEPGIPGTPAYPDKELKGHVQKVWTNLFSETINMCDATIKALNEDLYDVIVSRGKTKTHERMLMCEILIDALGSGKPVYINGFSHPYSAGDREGTYVVTRVEYYVPEERRWPPW